MYKNIAIAALAVIAGVQTSRATYYHKQATLANENTVKIAEIFLTAVTASHVDALLADIFPEKS